MIAVDTLVHNFLHRTGILHRLRADHAYGLACYRPGGCAEIIETVAQRIDATQFNRRFPITFPRFVQHAIWRYCAQQGLDVCNGNQIDDRKRCGNIQCSLYEAYPVDSGPSICSRRGARDRPARLRGLSRLMMSQYPVGSWWVASPSSASKETWR